ncbi:hypothetical protein QQ045_010817 [Rhodiola kirilowii]
MPTASTSQILGNNECFEPYTSNIYSRRVLRYDNGSILKVTGIPEELKEIYKTVWEIKQRTLVDMAVDRGCYIDQSQSLNIHMDQANFGKLTSLHFYAWSKKPYDVVGVAEWSSFKNGVHTLWVYSTDKLHTRDSHTYPRTEIRITGYDYSSGVWQFEAFGYVPSNTSRVVVEARTVQIYINSELKYEASGRQGSTHYFKCGVYAQDDDDDDSDYMESQWKQIKVLKKEH